jgi:hypothetical protein
MANSQSPVIPAKAGNLLSQTTRQKSRDFVRRITPANPRAIRHLYDPHPPPAQRHQIGEPNVTFSPHTRCVSLDPPPSPRHAGESRHPRLSIKIPDLAYETKNVGWAEPKAKPIT